MYKLEVKKINGNHFIEVRIYKGHQLGPLHFKESFKPFKKD
ncbi:hypothetical protein Phi17:1_gp20 [Cellulophaga phage phi17:1]|uniref:Uncharacterized protein n=1 Tax=Cellulophaga phage phi17:1 TaxID=1327980 RepID=R9ZYU9_9CAUD|nr:hypothetical protein Phi17:1_gp20 [Cellulophaga phage phi17:1]AGO48296.1 hypothetical protein Phi17:1_gp20 [Cellulophaga phage phi17:1]